MVENQLFFTYICSIFIGVILTALLDMMFANEFLLKRRFYTATSMGEPLRGFPFHSVNVEIRNWYVKDYIDAVTAFSS